MNSQVAILKMLPSLEIVAAINELLRELQDRNCPILDYDDCGFYLDRVEYHKAEDVNGDKFGDGTDNLYCFFEGRCDDDK